MLDGAHAWSVARALGFGLPVSSIADTT